jgi:predicted acyl esterase
VAFWLVNRISYYAGTQWRVAAKQPKGLAAIIPWEGMSDYYRDRCRHGGILSNTFLKWWWDRQVVSNQYGRPGRAARNWGPDTMEGDLSVEELAANRSDQTIDNVKYRFRDEEYYASKDYNLEDIKVRRSPKAVDTSSTTVVDETLRHHQVG